MSIISKILISLIHFIKFPIRESIRDASNLLEHIKKITASFGAACLLRTPKLIYPAFLNSYQSFNEIFYFSIIITYTHGIGGAGR